MAEDLPPILGVGAHLKNTVALSVGRQVFLSQHIGDLETPEALAAFERVIADFLRLYETTPAAIAHDLHPDYLSTRWAQQQKARLIAVQHHHAHLAACLAENGAEGPALGVAWDGTGLGTDDTIWGGEFLLGDAAGFRRVAHLRPFRLPGGEAAVREPRRTALALLWDMNGAAGIMERNDLAAVTEFCASDRHMLVQMLERGINSPVTTSMGRLFDGVAALLGLRQTVTFEGQAAMALEFAADAHENGAYPLPVVGVAAAESGALVLDWRPLVAAILADKERGVDSGIIAARFHNALIAAIVAVASAIETSRVALSGGCFQNRLLTERAAYRLREAGFEVLLHRQTPPNDGCIALGQVAVAAARLAEQRSAGVSPGGVA
jgi:hydrogenase maturation protein HypF